MSELWDKVEALIASGQGVTIQLRPEWEVKLPKRRSRRYKKSWERRWIDYLGGNGMSRPRCRRKGCQNYLRKHQPAVCSTRCRQLLVKDCLRSLELVDYCVEPDDPEREIEEALAMREADLKGRWDQQQRVSRNRPK